MALEETLALVTKLADPARRRAAARALAVHLGASDLIVFVRDLDLDVLLPAPGFPQTLPRGRIWRDFLRGCRSSGPHSKDLSFPDAESITPATAYASDGIVLVFLGGTPRRDDVDDVVKTLPLLASAFRGELKTISAQGHVDSAQQAAQHAENATAALEAVRVELQRALGEAEAAVRVRDDFLSIAGHELRTPLNALHLFQLAVLRQAQAANEPRIVEGLQKAERQVARLTRLITELLDVSRITAGRMTLEPEDTDLSEVARDVVARFEEVSSSPVKGFLILKADAPVIGNWDRMRIEQVMTNLIENAIKFGERRPIEITVERNGTAGWLKVQDHGIGIGREDQRHIFERFQRAVSEQHYGGFGLGL
ncbi:MAG TPA: HAMP domain-containing sensor histidine kinase, partial [Thermoanaerobaculia bacterium]|nr:HAMP domain-containing sensor histidine kinase [Thermoanaerobaculia bacterium]